MPRPADNNEAAPETRAKNAKVEEREREQQKAQRLQAPAGFVSAIIGQVVRVHDGDADAETMQEFTVARRAKVTLNGKRCGLADINPGDAVQFGGGSPREGFREVKAVRPKEAGPARPGPADLSKPRTVQRVEPSEPKLEAQYVDKGTPPEKVGQTGDAIKNQPPAKPHFDERDKHTKVSGDRGADEHVTSEAGADSDTGDAGADTKSHVPASGVPKSGPGSERKATDHGKTPPPKRG